jgi:hypothetical protein
MWIQYKNKFFSTQEWVTCKMSFHYHKVSDANNLIKKKTITYKLNQTKTQT